MELRVQLLAAPVRGGCAPRGRTDTHTWVGQQMGQVGGAGEGVSGGGGGGGDEVPFDPMLFPLDGMDDMAWLNTIDWTQGSWMDFN
jgi:hypothetical protein